MQTTRFTLLSGLALAVVLTLLVGQMPVFGQDDRERSDGSRLEGTWNVTLTFGSPTGCAGGGPFENLNTYLEDGTLLVSPGRLFAGPGQGRWKRIGANHFEASFTFLVFKSDGSGALSGSEVVMKDIRLTHDAFKANSTFVFTDTMGNETTPPGGCPITENATRFE